MYINFEQRIVRSYCFAARFFSCLFSVTIRWFKNVHALFSFYCSSFLFGFNCFGVFFLLFHFTSNWNECGVCPMNFWIIFVVHFVSIGFQLKYTARLENSVINSLLCFVLIIIIMEFLIELQIPCWDSCVLVLKNDSSAIFHNANSFNQILESQNKHTKNWFIFKLSMRYIILRNAVCRWIFS